MSETHQPITNLDEIADLFRSLGQQTRLRLLCLPRTGEHSVGEIDTLLAIGQPGLSQQLAILRAVGLVTTRRVAKQVYYRLNPEAFAQIANLLSTLSQSSPRPTPAEKPRKPRPAAAGFARML